MVSSSADRGKQTCKAYMWEAKLTWMVKRFKVIMLCTTTALKYFYMYLISLSAIWYVSVLSKHSLSTQAVHIMLSSMNIHFVQFSLPQGNGWIVVGAHFALKDASVWTTRLWQKHHRIYLKTCTWSQVYGDRLLYIYTSKQHSKIFTYYTQTVQGQVCALASTKQMPVHCLLLFFYNIYSSSWFLWWLFWLHWLCNKFFLSQPTRMSPYTLWKQTIQSTLIAFISW